MKRPTRDKVIAFLKATVRRELKELGGDTESAYAKMTLRRNEFFQTAAELLSMDAAGAESVPDRPGR